MKITMISNAMSHHQKPFCDCLAGLEDVEFHFIATKSLADERRNMGYSDLNHSSKYIVRSYESDLNLERAKNLIQNSDFVIFGSAPYGYIKGRLKNGQWTFLYSERIFKKRTDYLQKLKLWIIYFLRYGCYSRKKIKVLCASAYAAGDFSKFGFQQEQFYQWGYFPKESSLDIIELLKNKKEKSIVWVGRMIHWKHPKTAIQLAYRLKNDNIPFHLTMIGNGELFDMIKGQISELALDEYVTLTGALPVDEVRRIMEQSEILVTTSDQNEGWGAVINEAMSSACAVCASCEMGAAPFLIQDGKNGYLFHYADQDTLFSRVKNLLLNPEQREEMARNAFFTIEKEWNGVNAANKLVELCSKLQSGETDFAFPDGICSIADKNLK